MAQLPDGAPLVRDAEFPRGAFRLQKHDKSPRGPIDHVLVKPTGLVKNRPKFSLRLE
jgi:hypothetical protein